MTVELIQGDRRTSNVRFCERWLSAADELREQIFDNGGGFDALRYNETATVGFLVAAAGRAKFLALPEFAENNRRLPQGRVRAGRCDLWIANEDWSVNWMIEFKVSWFGPRSQKGLVSRMNEAVKDAFGRDRQEAADRWGCVVYCPSASWNKSDNDKNQICTGNPGVERLSNFVDLGFKISGSAGVSYILFKRIPPLARSLDRNLLDGDLIFGSR